MFIGHFGVALAAKKAAPKTSLGTLITASILIDLFWPIFLLLGWEQVRIVAGLTAFNSLDFTHYPLTHSLLAVLGWGLAFGGLYWLFTRYRTGAIIVGIVTVSHWFLDAIVHIPDLPLAPFDSPKVGLGLWNSVIGTILVEGAIFVIGIWIYTRATVSRNKTGTMAFWGYVLFLIVGYVANIIGPPPPDARAIGYVGLSMFILPLWAWWIDRNRRLRA